MKEFCYLKDKKIPNLPRPDQIIYAGQSPRRKLFFHTHFPDASILSIPAGEEPDIPDVVSIAHSKINDVLAQVDGQITYGGKTVVIGADTRTSVATIDETDNFQFISKGKPKTVADLKGTFTSLAAVADIGETPQYVVESGTVSYFDGYDGHAINKKRNEVKEDCVVTLDADWVRYLAKDEGLGEYLMAFQIFYSSHPYTSSSSHIIRPTDLSGGLSLPTLVKLGAVESVADIPKNSSFFEETLRYEIFVVAVGVSPNVIEPFNPIIRSNIAKWPWLNAVTNLALNK